MYGGMCCHCDVVVCDYYTSDHIISLYSFFEVKTVLYASLEHVDCVVTAV